MGLTVVERYARDLFRDTAQARLASPDAPGGDSAIDCPSVLSVWRHECPLQEGRTRPIRLDSVRWINPEIWVAWSFNRTEQIDRAIAEQWDKHALQALILENGHFEALWPAEAERRMQAGTVAEYEVIIGGRFSFSWRHGQCRKCHMHIRSRDGLLGENAPRYAHRGPGTDRMVKLLPEVCAP